MGALEDVITGLVGSHLVIWRGAHMGQKVRPHGAVETSKWPKSDHGTLSNEIGWV